MPAKHHTVLDNRGFFFALPTLGLQEPGNGWVAVVAAIGVVSNAINIAKMLVAPGKDLKERKASKDCHIVTVDFEGGTWLLPKLAPLSKSPTETEVFALYVKRLAGETPQDGASLKLEDSQNIVCVPGPADGPVLTKTLATPKPMAGLQALEDQAATLAYLPSAAAILTSKQGVRQLTAAEQDIEKDFNQWDLMISGTFTFAFLLDMALAFGKEPKIMLGLESDSGGEGGADNFVGLTYAVRRKGDLTNIRDDEWKSLPSYAMLPGRQRHQVNVCRRVLAGKGPLPPPPLWRVED